MTLGAGGPLPAGPVRPQGHVFLSDVTWTFHSEIAGHAQMQPVGQPVGQDEVRK